MKRKRRICYAIKLDPIYIGKKKITNDNLVRFKMKLVLFQSQKRVEKFTRTIYKRVENFFSKNFHCDNLRNDHFV